MLDTNAAKRIIAATGEPLSEADPEVLAEDLRDAFDTYNIWCAALKSPPTEKQRRETFEAIEKRASSLLKALGVGMDDALPKAEPHLYTDLTRQARQHAESVGGFPGLQKTPYVGDGGEGGEKITVIDYQESTAVRRAVEGVQGLAYWAQTGIAEMACPDWVQWDFGEGPSAKLWLVGKGLPSVYSDHASKPFGTSNPFDGDGPAYGPGIRFVQACLEILGMHNKPDAIARQYRRYRQQWDNGT
jgi:hypothetical protein